MCSLRSACPGWSSGWASLAQLSNGLGPTFLIEPLPTPLLPSSGGITQGSILGTVLFYLYLLLLGIILQKNNICFHYYADDCQIYFPLMQIAASSLISALITSELPTQHTVKLVMVEDVEGPDFLLHVLSVTLLSSVKTTGTPLDNLLVLVFTSKCQSSCTALHRTH